MALKHSLVDSIQSREKSVNLTITLIEIAANKIQRVKRENEKEKIKEEKLQDNIIYFNIHIVDTQKEKKDGKG